MDKEMFNKIVAIMLVFLLCFADIALLGSQIVEAASVFNDDLEKQSTEIGKTEVAFDAYFQDGVGKKHSKKIAPEEEDKIYLEVKVPEGYLTEASIKIENANFKVQETDEELSIVQEISSDDNKITLNKINKGEAVILEVPIKIEEKTSISVDDISKKADVKLQGKYVDNEGKEMWLDKTIEVESTISTEVESLLTEEVSKYVSFDVNGSRGVILQTLIKSKLVDNKLPIKSTTFDIQIPVLNNEEPEVITLTANSMMATNGEKTRVFTDEDYEIENGVIKLTIKNSDELLSWEKETEDELLLTCIYGENAISNVQTQVALNTKTSIEYYSDEVKTVEAEVNETKELTEQIGDIINLSLETNKNELYKGYMKTEGAQDTIFDDKIDINIGYSKLVDKLLFKDETTYTDVDGNMFPSKGVYKYTRINKDNFEELLGEEGYINIYKEDGTLLVTLNKDNLEYTYEEELTNVIFETSKPLTEGILEIENGRGIKSGEYSAEQVARFAKYSVNLICNIIKDDQVIISGNQGKDIELIEDETKADLVLSQDRLSTVALNEGVEVRVNLKTTEENSTLYKNPKIKITFPQYITGISAENVKLLYEDELKIKEAKMYVNETNNQVIEIALEGEQTKYNDVAMAEGATLIVDTDISVDKLTPSRTLQAELEVVNEKNGQTVIENKDVNFVAPVGMMTINQMTGYNELGESATAVGGEMAVGKIQKNTASKTARVSITVANNYNYACENIKILGRTPFQGNKSIKTQDDLNSTFTAKMLSGISIVSGLNAEDITVYYSENGDATTEQDGDGNNWRTDITDFSNIKSYMIVINNKTLQTGESISFNYDVEIPENLESNQSAYSTFAVYYSKSADEESRDPQTSASTNESTESTPVGITTGEGPNLKVILEANVANETEITEGDFITYTAKVTNNGKMPATNVTLTVNLPEQAYLATYNNSTEDYDVDYENKVFTFTIDEIGIGKTETETVKFTIKAGLFIEIPEEEPLPEKTLEQFKNNQTLFDKYNEARRKQQAGEEVTAEEIYPDSTLDAFGRYTRSF